MYPDQTFTNVWQLKIGNEQVVAKYYGFGHTSGDVVIAFESANVVHMGDLVFNRFHPFIDRAGGRVDRQLDHGARSRAARAQRRHHLHLRARQGRGWADGQPRRSREIPRLPDGGARLHEKADRRRQIQGSRSPRPRRCADSRSSRRPTRRTSASRRPGHRLRRADRRVTGVRRRSNAEHAETAEKCDRPASRAATRARAPRCLCVLSGLRVRSSWPRQKSASVSGP